MQRIIGHHDAGGYNPSTVSRNAYHRLIDGSGNVHNGKFPISANAGNLVPGKYAAHCLNMNSGSIGLAICAMADAQWSNPFGSSKYPVTDAQVKSFIEEAARLCAEYGIKVTRQTVLTHAEVQLTLGVKQKGKWDFDYDIFDRTATRDPLVVGDKWRDRVLAHTRGLLVKAPAPVSMPTVRQGTMGTAVIELQKALKLTADGIFGPKTREAVVTFQRSRQLLPDGIVGPATWAALGTSK